MRSLRVQRRSVQVFRPDPLSPRSREVLYAVIRSHVDEGEPVGSRTVARMSRENLSSATIRSVMADLEEKGLLSQPHASAGRVPTDLAYRLYVDTYLSSTRRPATPPSDEALIARTLAETHGEIPAVLEEASRLLSRLSRNVGVVLTPNLSQVVLERVDFVKLEGRRVLVVIVDPAGVVTHRLVEAQEEIAEHDLDRMGRILSDGFTGLTLPEARGRLQVLMAEERARYDTLQAQTLALAERSFAELEEGDTAGVFIGGASNILNRSDLISAEQTRDLLRGLEEKAQLVGLLGRCLGVEGVSVRIGAENEDPWLRHCAVLAASYGVPGRPLGTVGIIGPTRMEYERAISLVEALSRALSSVIGQQGTVE